MSWPRDLWDQFDNLFLYSQTGIDYCDNLARFFKDKTNIDSDYSSKLKKLVAFYQPKICTENDENKRVTIATSTTGAFDIILKEVNEMASQKESLCDIVNKEILPALSKIVQNMKQVRKLMQQKYVDEQTNYRASRQLIDKIKKSHRKAVKDSQKAHEIYQKAEADMNLSRAEIERAKVACQAKETLTEEKAREYKQELLAANDKQKDYYSTKLPAILQKMQEAEESRIVAVQQQIEKFAYSELQSLSVCEQCLGRIFNIVPTISATEDIALVAKKLKSGKSPPSDEVFDNVDMRRDSISNSDDSGSSIGSISSNKKSKSLSSLVIAGSVSSMSTLPRRTAPAKPSYPLPDVVDKYPTVYIEDEGNVYQNASNAVRYVSINKHSTSSTNDFTRATPADVVTALHSFNGSESGSLKVIEKELLRVLSEDAGNGWTLVEKLSGESGYVPTSYISKHSETNSTMSFRL